MKWCDDDTDAGDNGDDEYEDNDYCVLDDRGIRNKLTDNTIGTESNCSVYVTRYFIDIDNSRWKSSWTVLLDTYLYV